MARDWDRESPYGIQLEYIMDGKLNRSCDAISRNSVHVRDCLYVDDAVSMNASREDQEEVAKSFQRVAAKWGMNMSIRKTKLVVEGEEGQDLEVEGGSIESVDSFPYLGSVVNSSGTLGDEIKLRLSKARRAFYGLWNHVWHTRGIGMGTKVNIYKACVLSTLLYGSETWPVTVKQINQLERFHMGCIRWISGTTRRMQHTGRLSNEALRARTGLESIQEYIHQRVLRWLGHVARMSTERLPKKLLFAWEQEGTRSRDHGLPRFRDVANRALKSRGVDKAIWLQLAQDRGEWRRVVHGTYNSGYGSQHSETEAVEEVDANGMMRCPFPGCGHKCLGRRGLAKHCMIVHTQGTDAENGFTCDLCPYRSVTRAGMTKHKNKAHGPDGVECVHCGAFYPGERALRTHRTRDHRELYDSPPGPDGRFHCQVCNVSYTSAPQLGRHRTCKNHWD